MSTEIAPYRQATVTVGHLEQESIEAVFMPRGDFLDVVQATLDMVQATLDSEEKYLPIAEKVLETAWSVQRFPFGQWIHETRGCGCLVGEMLVADEVIEEYNRRVKAGVSVVTEEMNTDARRKLTERPIESSADIESLLRERYPAEHVQVLRNFGEAIDEAMKSHLDETTPDWNASAIIVED
jgi:hypothetical protein